MSERCTDAMGSESFHPRCHLEAGHDGPHERSHADWLEDRVAFLEDEGDRYHHDLIRVMGERNDARARIDHALAVQSLDDAADFAAGYNEALADLKAILEPSS